MQGNKESKWFTETFIESFMDYDQLQRFINSLNTKERRVVGYETKQHAVGKEIKVTFARLEESSETNRTNEKV